MASIWDCNGTIPCEMTLKNLTPASWLKYHVWTVGFSHVDGLKVTIITEPLTMKTQFHDSVQIQNTKSMKVMGCN